MIFKFNFILSKTNIMLLSYIFIFILNNLIFKNQIIIDSNYILENNLIIYYPVLLIKMFFHTNLWNLYIDCYLIYILGNFVETILPYKKLFLLNFLISIITTIIVIIFYYLLGEKIIFNEISGYLGIGLVGFYIGKILLYENNNIFKRILFSCISNILFFLLLSYLLGFVIFEPYFIIVIIAGLISSILIKCKIY